MIPDDKNSEVIAEIQRLAVKRGWPHAYEAAQLELVRVAKKYARDLSHLAETITKLCENLSYCPDSRELKIELRGGNEPPEETEAERRERDRKTREYLHSKGIYPAGWGKDGRPS